PLLLLSISSPPAQRRLHFSLHDALPILAGGYVLDHELLPTVRADLPHAHHAQSDQPGGHSRCAETGLRLNRRADHQGQDLLLRQDRKSTRLNSSHVAISYAASRRKKKIH